MVGPNPFANVLEITGGYVLPRCLHVIADLGVADALDETPRTAAELAGSVGADPDALGRVLRLLAAHDVFAVDGDTFRHSASSRLLRTDHPQSLRAFARMFGSSLNWASYGKLEHTVRTGLPAKEKLLPQGLWAYYAAHPDERAIFDAAMAGKSHAAVAAIMAAYDFSRFGRIGDVGGGRGHLLQAVLAATPAACGVLFDLPQAIAAVTELASARLALQAGDFFADTLPVCDGYLLMEVIHDWDDERALAILRALRRAAPPHATLLVIEQMLPSDPGPHWAKTVDIHMMAMLGGRQRTQQEYAALLDSAGFAFKRQVDTHADIAILEAVSASSTTR